MVALTAEQPVSRSRTEPDPAARDCLHGLFEAQVARTPHLPAVACAPQVMTYAELDRRAGLLARRLQALGAGPDMPVALLVERSPEMVVGIMGILKAGAAYLPVDDGFPRERIAFMLADAGVTLALTQRSLRDAVPLAEERIVCLDEVAWSGSATPRLAGTPVRGENLAYIIYTSGSTGRPKGVGIEHRNIVNYVVGMASRLKLEPGLNHAMVSTVAADLGHTPLFGALATGGCVHVISNETARDQALLSEYFEENGIDLLKIVPSHLAALQTGMHPERVMPRKHLVLGGEPVRTDWSERIQRLAPGCRIYNEYGPTETTVGVAEYEFGAPPPSTATLPLGTALPNVFLYILDDAGRPVTRGERGELFIGGHGVGRGYLNRRELTAERFVPDPFSEEPGARMYRSGDVALEMPDGSVVYCGRFDDQVKVHGFRVELGEVEAALREHEGVREVVVVARAESTGDNELCACLVPTRALAEGARPSPSSDDGSLTAAALRAFLGGRLPAPMIPSTFVFMEEFPLTANGKVDRISLAQASQVPQSSDEVRPAASTPLTATQSALVAVFAELLKVENVGIDDDFFDLGGHSLLAISAVSRIRDSLGVNVGLRNLFNHSTVADLAAVVDGLR